MGKLPSVSSKQVIRALSKAGFEEAPMCGKGSHRAFCRRHAGQIKLVIVPKGKDIPKGTLLSILAQAGMTRDEFVAFL
jgi:predicted RNA binding protein YcfA (HicA-like mRNA interferase family)